MNLLRRWWGGVAISIIRPFPVLLRSWTATFSSRWTLVRLPRKRNYLRCSLGIFGISRIEEMTLDGYLLGIECFLGDKLTLSETSKSFVARPSLCIAFQFYIHLKAKRSSNEISPSEALKLWCLQNMDGVGFQEFLYPCVEFMTFLHEFLTDFLRLVQKIVVRRETRWPRLNVLSRIPDGLQKLCSCIEEEVNIDIPMNADKKGKKRGGGRAAYLIKRQDWCISWMHFPEHFLTDVLRGAQILFKTWELDLVLVPVL